MIISFDPGKITGYVVWEKILNKVSPIKIGILQYGDELFTYLFNILQHKKISLFIVEDYKIRPPKEGHNFTQVWITPIPIKVIGILEFIAKVHHIEIVKQQPAVMPLGYKLMGAKRSKTKNKHQHIQDALAHGTYYLHRQGFSFRER